MAISEQFRCLIENCIPGSLWHNLSTTLTRSLWVVETCRIGRPSLRHRFSRPSLTCKIQLQLQLRAAVMAGNRLCMVTAISKLCIFTFAEVAHRKVNHRRVVAVIRNAVDNRVSRPAYHAADERVLVSRIAFIVKFLETVRAYRQIRRNHCRFIVAVITLQNRKSVKLTVFFISDFNMYDFGRHRFFLLNGSHKLCDSFRCISNCNFHQPANVQDFALHFHAVCNFRNKRAEADALDDPPQFDALCYFFFHNFISLPAVRRL